MTPSGWIALAYGVVAATLLTYALSLRNRIRRAEQAAQNDPGSPGGRPR